MIYLTQPALTRYSTLSILNLNQFPAVHSSYPFRETILSSICHAHDDTVYTSTNPTTQQFNKMKNQYLFQSQQRQSQALRRHNGDNKIHLISLKMLLLLC